MSKRTKTIVIILSVLLFVLGIAIYSTFIQWYLVKGEGIKYVASGVSDQFSQMILFSLTIAIIPLSALVFKLRKTKNIFISTGILIGFILAAIVVKRSLLIYNIEKFYVPSINGEKLETHLSLTKSSPETYMVIALIVGHIFLIILRSQRLLFRNEYE